MDVAIMAQAAPATLLPDERADWSGLFSRVGSELQSLAAAVNGLQRLLAPLVADAVARDPSAVTRLQDLDLVEQSLQNLSEFMSCLDASTALTDVSALSMGIRTIRLAALANRLSPVAAMLEPEPENAGFELF